MKGHVKIRGNFHHILVVLPAAIIMLFAFAIMLPVVSESTHAEGDEPEEGISVFASSDISVNLLSKDEGYYKIFKDSIKVSTSSENGYTLSIATDSADHQTLYLNGDTTSESKIDGASGTYEEPKALDDYEWGFAVPGISRFDDTYSTTEPSTNSKFAILPLENKVIRDYAEAATDNITDIYYGFKLSGTLELGEYKTAITYTAIPADQPLTAKAILTQNGNLDFVYDRNMYESGETYSYNITGANPVNAIIANIYTVPTNSTSSGNIGWTSNNNVKSANFELSFFDFKPTSTAYWFYGDYYLASITNANNLDTSRTTNMQSMFENAGLDATTFNADLGGWNTSNVTNMHYMFKCYYVQLFGGYGYRACKPTTWSIGDLSGWDTGNVADMHGMFYYAGYSATAWTIGDLSGWNTKKNTDMTVMFGEAGYSASTWDIGDIGKWDVGNVQTMDSAFRDAGYKATTWNVGNLSGWNTSNVTDMSYMFKNAGYNATAWDIGNLNYVDEEHKGWDVSKVTKHSDFVVWNQSNIDTSKLPWQSN